MRVKRLIALFFAFIFVATPIALVLAASNDSPLTGFTIIKPLKVTTKTSQQEPQKRQAATNQRKSDGCVQTLIGEINGEITCVTGQTVTVIGDAWFVSPGKLILEGATLEFNGPHKLEFEAGTEFRTSSAATVLGGGGRSSQQELIAKSGSAVNWEGSDFSGLAKLIVYGNTARIVGNTFHDNIYAQKAFDESDFQSGNGLTLVCVNYAVIQPHQALDGYYAEIRDNAFENNANAGLHVESCNAITITGTQASENKVGIRVYKKAFETEEQQQENFASLSFPSVTLKNNNIYQNENGIITYETKINTQNQLGTVQNNDYYGIVFVDVSEPQQTLINEIGTNGEAKAALMFSARVEARDPIEPNQPLNDKAYIIGLEGGEYYCTAGYSNARYYAEPNRKYACTTTTSELYTNQNEWHKYTTPDSIRRFIYNFENPLRINNHVSELFLTRRFYWDLNGNKQDACKHSQEKYCSFLVFAEGDPSVNEYIVWSKFQNVETDRAHYDAIKLAYGYFKEKPIPSQEIKPQTPKIPKITTQTKNKETSSTKTIKPARIILKNLG